MKLNYKKTFLVGFAFFLICTFWQAYDTIVPKILTDKFGLSQTVSGVVMALDNILALFMLPLFGSISDKCKSKMGRRSPFILFGTIVAVIAFVMMSFADLSQLKQIEMVAPTNENAQVILYDANLTIKTLDGQDIEIQKEYSKEQFVGIQMNDADGKVTEEYTNIVVPARQAFAANATKENPGSLIFFISMLLIALVSMATFRSPAVALMPDVTIKPLRSKGNSVINLMGAAGGIVVLGLGIVMKTGNATNALMSYVGFFAIIAGIMAASLFIFKLTVNEPKLVAEMEEESARLGIDTQDDNEEAAASGDRKLSKKEFVSLMLILASVVFWFMGYNAVTSKYSVYASTVLNVDYNTTLIIAQAAAIVSYLPIGFISTRFGRKKTIMAGVIMLFVSFFAASFLRSGTSAIILDVLFVIAGFGWAAINVNSYPMVVELSRGGNVGKYTGFYYTASMAAQTLTPILSGFLMDQIGMTVLFVYSSIAVVIAFFTMMFVKHGDTKNLDKAEPKDA